jgi:hypothetical protein
MKLNCVIVKDYNRDSAVGIADWLRAGRPRSRSSSTGRGEIFSSPRRPPGLLSNGYP